MVHKLLLIIFMFVFICVKLRMTFGKEGGIVTTPLCQLTIIVVSIILNLGRACFFEKREKF